MGRPMAPYDLTLSDVEKSMSLKIYVTQILKAYIS